MTSAVMFPERLLDAIYLNRPNRFLASVQIKNRTLVSFVPNPGRMCELLRPGTRVILREMKREGRKTCFDLVGVYHRGQKVSVDSRLPNRLVYVALKEGDIEELSGYTEIAAEYTYGHSRFDFLLASHSERCLLEVKSCTFVENGRALFPDAVTRRGRKHVEQLARSMEEGFRASILFIVQRVDVSCFSPNDEVDPEFGKALRRAAEEGVEVYAYSSQFKRNKVSLKRKLKVEL